MAISGAVIVELLGDQGNVVDYTVSDGTGISKGDLLKFADPRTASVGAGAAAGIAAADKEASDGAVNLGVYTYGIFDLQTNMVITAGNYVAISSGNLIKAATSADASSGLILGQALETAAGSGDVIEVKVNL